MSDHSSIIASVDLIDSEVKSKAIKELPKWEERESWIKTISKNIYVYEWDRLFNRKRRTLHKWTGSIFLGFVLLLCVSIVFDYFGIEFMYYASSVFYITLPLLIWIGSIGFKNWEAVYFESRLKKYKDTRPMHDEDDTTPRNQPPNPPPSSSPFDVPPQQ